MLSSQVVIGLGFGDEGKGLVANHLVSKHPDSLVVRFSGGHQAGHTVVHEGKRHVFSSFGSGTLQGASTYISHKCTVDPIAVVRELKVLEDLMGREMAIVNLFIDDDAMVTTPYDAYANREEDHLSQHGSCGVGFGKTIERNEDSIRLTYSDLFNPTILKIKLGMIKEYYLSVDLHMEEFLEAVKELTDVTTTTFLTVKKVSDLERALKNRGAKNIVYEGSQGLLLDQKFGFFPHVTRSNTGVENVMFLNFRHKAFDVYYVTRAYQTRHGNGPMTNREHEQMLRNNRDENNVSNFQGDFRIAPLDLDLLHYGLNKDRGSDSLRSFRGEEHLVITCLDQIDKYIYSVKGVIHEAINETLFVRRISQILGITNVHLSHSPDSQLRPFL